MMSFVLPFLGLCDRDFFFGFFFSVAVIERPTHMNRNDGDDGISGFV